MKWEDGGYGGKPSHQYGFEANLKKQDGLKLWIKILMNWLRVESVT